MTPRILVAPRGPLAAGSVVFRDNHGHFVCTIVLENLHPRHSRLVMTLSGLEPVAIVLGHAEPLRLRADLLVIDSDRALCTLTFRGHLPIGETSDVWQIVVTMVSMGATLTPDQIQVLTESVSGAEVLDEIDFENAEDALELTHDIGPDALAKMAPGAATSALPFSGALLKPPPPAGKRKDTITTVTELPKTCCDCGGARSAFCDASSGARDAA